MCRLTNLAVALYLTTLVSNQLNARDDGRFANSPLKPWFDRLASGKGLCCSFADGATVRLNVRKECDLDEAWQPFNPLASHTQIARAGVALSRAARGVPSLYRRGRWLSGAVPILSDPGPKPAPKASAKNSPLAAEPAKASDIDCRRDGVVRWRQDAVF